MVSTCVITKNHTHLLLVPGTIFYLVTAGVICTKRCLAYLEIKEYIYVWRVDYLLVTLGPERETLSSRTDSWTTRSGPGR